jgi:hypothetical protein
MPRRGKRARTASASIMAHPSPLSALCAARYVVGAMGAPPLWQNTIEYKWLGAGDVCDGCVYFRSCRLTGDFGERGCGARRLRKEGPHSD